VNTENFLPVSQEDMIGRGWYYYDFLIVTGDAYIDHPSFGSAVISRVLEAEGYRVAVLAQPNWHSAEAFAAMGRPRYGAFVSAGNLDSMVAHYTAAKKRRSEDFYSPGKRSGLRPDRASIVYANRLKEAFPGLSVVIGGLEASLRRFAHYDYWEDSVRRSVLFDSKADCLVYGMGERATREVAQLLKRGSTDFSKVRGAAWKTSDPANCQFEYVECASYEEICEDKKAFAKAVMLQYREHDPIRGKAVVQQHAKQWLVVNPPAMPLSTEELDRVAELPYTRTWHPMYDPEGCEGAIAEVRFSIIHNRGCFGACNFCALAFHQGRMVTARSEESVLREAQLIIKDPEFKGYIHDVGGPTANFGHPSCKKQLKQGMCADRQCLFPSPCPNIDPDHSDYLRLLRKLRELPGVKKVFVRSGIRYDYMLCDKNGEFFSELTRHHISGQLKVAPEHCSNKALWFMGKPRIEVYERFMDKYKRLNQRWEKEQYIVPYLMSSHPGCTLNDAVDLAVYLNKTGRQPEQVQDFYPTPGTLSTCMYYTGIDPRNMDEIYVARTPEEKALQRALLQWKRPDKRSLVIKALQLAGREELIGYGKEHLVRPDRNMKNGAKPKVEEEEVKPKPHFKHGQRPEGWAKPKKKNNPRRTNKHKKNGN